MCQPSVAEMWACAQGAEIAPLPFRRGYGSHSMRTNTNRRHATHGMSPAEPSTIACRDSRSSEILACAQGAEIAAFPLDVDTNQHSMRTHTDRRHVTRGMSPAEPSRSHLVSSIVGAYREMPGLSLHVSQAARLFGVQPVTCQVVLDRLVDDGQLRRSADGQYRLR
jgi:hypothetical protein